MSTERNYGIDFLRLGLMFMVCIIHILNRGGILSAAESVTVSNYVYKFLFTLTLCAVDSFALISGYMASNKTPKYEKLVRMWFQVFFYSFLLWAILSLFGLGEGFSLKAVKHIFPVTFGAYWYFTAYFVLFLAMPLLNKFLFAIDEQTAKKFFVGMIVIFSVLESVYFVFKTEYGYSALWLIVLYCLGVLAKRIHLFEKRKNITLIILFMISTAVSWAVYVLFDFSRIVSYTSPTMVLNGMLLVILFSRLKFKGTIIQKLSPLAFGIYLFQLNSIIWNDVLANRFAFIAEMNIFVGVGLSLCFSFALFAAGMLVEYLRSKLEKLLRIDLLSVKIVSLFDRLLTFSFRFLA